MTDIFCRYSALKSIVCKESQFPIKIVKNSISSQSYLGLKFHSLR